MKIEEKLNIEIHRFFKGAVRLFLSRPSLLSRANFILKQQQNGLDTRRKWKEKEINVPPMIIFSITNKCNLSCVGCYHHAQKRIGEDLATAEIECILGQAKELGISLALIAGGEPFTRPDLIKIIKKFPEILFLVFTNSTLIDRKLAIEIKKQKNMVPIISLEGDCANTNARRGDGVYQKLETALSLLNNSLFGFSVTVTKENLVKVTDPNFVQTLIKKGSSVLFFVEYVPFVSGTEDKTLNTKERKSLSEAIDKMRKNFSSLFISFPGDEAQYGGCLAAGRGFLHISASGQVEPCPFSPYSDVSLKDTSLKEALSSPLLEKIRSMSESLRETDGGCALFTNRETVEEIIEGN
ncbi:MAG: radical SAM protein [Candidatus Berkelbacteria bacterium]